MGNRMDIAVPEIGQIFGDANVFVGVRSSPSSCSQWIFQVRT